MQFMAIAMARIHKHHACILDWAMHLKWMLLALARYARTQNVNAKVKPAVPKEKATYAMKAAILVVECHLMFRKSEKISRFMKER